MMNGAQIGNLVFQLMGVLVHQAFYLLCLPVFFKWQFFACLIINITHFIFPAPQGRLVQASILMPIDECSKLVLMKTIFGDQPFASKTIAKVFLSFCLSGRLAKIGNQKCRMKAVKCVIKK